MTEAFKVGQLVANDLQTSSNTSDVIKNGFSDIEPILRQNNVRHVSFKDWQKIDEREKAKGSSTGKPREKFTHVKDMMSQLD